MKVQIKNKRAKLNAKTVKVDTKRIKAIVKEAVEKTASRFKLDGEFLLVARGYKAFKTLSNKDYQLFGEGFANVRGCEMRIVSKRAVGQDTMITLDSKGYGFLIGKKLDSTSMQCGNVIIRLNAKKIMKSFTKYGDAVKYVFKAGEKGIRGCSADVRALSNGAQYSVISNGKRLTKINAGNGTGRHAEFTNSGNALKASTVKV